MVYTHWGKSDSKQRLAAATVAVVAAVTKFFSNPGMSVDELYEYIKRLTSHDRVLTEMVCFMFLMFVQDTAKKQED